MKHKTLHEKTRIVYRAFRRYYGKEKTQDECLRIFMAVFPHQYALMHSEKPTASIPEDVRNKLYTITRSWQPTKALKEVIDEAELFFGMPMPMNRRELIDFYLDITPVALAIRKLTPRECFRLMGVGEQDIDKIEASGISRSSQYKLAGNSIVAGTGTMDENGNYDGVLFHILRKLLIETEPDKSDKPVQLTLF